jgi:hypothetical protein
MHVKKLFKDAFTWEAASPPSGGSGGGEGLCMGWLCFENVSSFAVCHHLGQSRASAMISL